MREPIALAYLLRGRQTPSPIQLEFRGCANGGFKNALGRNPRQSFARSVINHVASFVSLQENAAERTLLDLLPHCLEWLEQTGEQIETKFALYLRRSCADRCLICIASIIPQKCARSKPPPIWTNTHICRGCVGEFWTHFAFGIFAILPA